MEYSWIKKTGLANVGRSRLQEVNILAVGGESYGGHFLCFVNIQTPARSEGVAVSLYASSLGKRLCHFLCESEALGSLAWLCLCQHHTNTHDFTHEGFPLFPPRSKCFLA